jgi:hypothetical protein
MDGARHVNNKTAAVQSFPGLSQLRSFRDSLAWLISTAAGAARILVPLTDAFQGGVGGNATVVWMDAMEKAFVDAKADLVNAVTLAHPSQAVELGLMVDSSSSHVGMALEQRR